MRAGQLFAAWERVKQSRLGANLIVRCGIDRYNCLMSTPSRRNRTQADPMLFDVAGGPSAEAEPADLGRGRPRLRTANRQQIVFRAAPLDALIPGDHPARVVWDYVEGLDLDPLYDRIKAVEGRPGRAPIDP